VHSPRNLLGGIINRTALRRWDQSGTGEGLVAGKTSRKKGLRSGRRRIFAYFPRKPVQPPGLATPRRGEGCGVIRKHLAVDPGISSGVGAMSIRWPPVDGPNAPQGKAQKGGRQVLIQRERSISPLVRYFFLLIFGRPPVRRKSNGSIGRLKHPNRLGGQFLGLRVSRNSSWQTKAKVQIDSVPHRRTRARHTPHQPKGADRHKNKPTA